jgi:hypothetical protein
VEHRLSGLGLIVTGLTLWVLKNTLDIADKQREVTEGQLGVMSKQLKEMEGAGQQTDKLIEQATKQAIAAKNTADAAQASIKVIQDSMRLEQRAWVGAIRSTHTEIKPDTGVTFDVVFMNSGRTPALAFGARLSTKLFSKDEKFVPTADIPGSNTVLQPGAQLIQSINVSFPDRVVNDIKSATHIYRLFGKFSYKDIFGYTHDGTFCMYLSADLKGLNACDFYNTAN